MRKILKTVSTIDELDMDLFERLNIGVEIQDFTEPNLTDTEVKDLIKGYKSKFKGFNGIKSLHGPFIDLKPASPDFKIREVSYKRYFETLEIAAELDMDYVIFHSQINPYLKEPFLSNLNNLQAKEMWVKLLKETKFKGILLVENVFEEDPKMLKEYMETLDLPNIRVNLDIGHVRLGNVNLEEWIRELKNLISYIHIHSNDRKYDKHESPTKEEIHSLYKLINKYNLNPVLSLEYKVENLMEEINKYL